jgi:hypothetical protein
VAVEAEIDRIDPGHVWRDAKELMPHYHPPAGHVEEAYIKEQLDIEVPKLVVGGFAAGYQVDLCYIVVDARVVCYHCYGILEDQAGGAAKQVSVTVGGHSVNVLVYFSYSTPPVH